MTTEVARYWLRKIGTQQVFARTAPLAERKDMEPISHEDAMRLLAAASQTNIEVAQRRAQAALEGNPPPVMERTDASTNIQSTEERQRLEEQVRAGIVPPSALSAPDAPPAPKTLEEMTRAELIEMAATMKVRIADNWGDAAIRKHIQGAIDAEAAVPAPKPEDEKDGE